MRPRVCMTEIHDRDAQTNSWNPGTVHLCRHEMTLIGPHGHPLWVWVCPNSACGTAHVVGPAEREMLLR